MADTYSRVYIQIVFTTKNRGSLIPNRNKDELYKYITGIVTKRGQKLIRINGMPDHLHILIGLKPSLSISDLVRDIKANSSKFICDKGWIKAPFNWQKGFGVFSYGHSQLNRIIQYIDNQEAHHHKISFREEYLNSLKRLPGEFKEKYIFEWLE